MRHNLVYIFAGLIFFFNPSFNLLDILPDFIGAALIMTGLSKMYMFDGNFEDAKRSAKFLLWISVLRFSLCLWVNSGHRDYVMPFTFIICVLEIIYMISMFKGLYLGLEYTLMRADSERLTKQVNEAFTFSFIFTFVSKLLEFAPNICDLIKQDAELDLSAGASYKMPMAQMKVYVLGACIVCSFILGVIYLFVTSTAWIKIIADKNYAPFIKGKYENYLENDREAFIASKMQTVYFLVMAGFVFLFNFYADGINLLPSVIGILLFFAASLYLSGISGTRKSLVFSLALPAAASSVICYIYMTRVHLGINSIFSLEAYYKSEFSILEENYSVIYALILAFMEFILTFALICLVISQMKCVFKKEKRSVGIPMLNFLTLPAFFACILPAAKSTLTTLEAHLATNKDVQSYVQNKAYIINEENYNSFMSNPAISQYESVSSVSYYLAFLAVIIAFICVLYTVRIRRFTEGDYEKK